MEEETSRHMLQQDGCTGDVVFLTYKTVRPSAAMPESGLSQNNCICRATAAQTACTTVQAHVSRICQHALLCR